MIDMVLQIIHRLKGQAILKLRFHENTLNGHLKRHKIILMCDAKADNIYLFMLGMLETNYRTDGWQCLDSDRSKKKTVLGKEGKL